MTTPRARRRLTRRTTANAVAVAPFTVVVDTREQLPWTFAQVPADRGELATAAKGRGGQGEDPAPVPPDSPSGLPSGAGFLVVPVVVEGLPAGDYSIRGYGERIAIERKSKADLFGTLGQGRDRFVRELDRLNAYDFAAVVVEAELSEILTDPPAHTSLSPKTITRSVIAWQQRFPRVHWAFLPGRAAAEVWAYRVLDRFWRDVIDPELKKDGAE